MRLAGIFALFAVVGLVAPGSAVLAAPAKKTASGKPAVSIPFESDRSQAIRINDDSTIIPAHRIRDVPVVNGKMGEHVRLDGGVELYFPFGRIVSAAMEFRPVRQSPTDPNLYEADPSYRQVAGFDRALGPVCASDTATAGPIEMRINGEAMSVVKTLATPPGDSGPSFRVVTVAESRWLENDPQVQRLLTNCLTGGKATSAVATAAPAKDEPGPVKAKATKTVAPKKEQAKPVTRKTSAKQQPPAKPASVAAALQD